MPSGDGFAALMFGISEGGQRGWGRPGIVASLVVGATLLLLLLRQQLRAREPLLALHMFAFVGAVLALLIHDADADATRTGPRSRRAAPVEGVAALPA